MSTMLWKLKNPIKNYEWGSKNMIPSLFGINNEDDRPIAEIWMGAHLSGASIAIDSNGRQIPLNDLISQDWIKLLGKKSGEQDHALPYLFKILSAESPLSIQVHPEISKAKQGFERENKLGIPLDSPKRNYKDPNHKPELVYAVTPFLAMNAFRPINEIVDFFVELKIDALQNEVEQLKNDNSPEQLKCFFRSILTLENEKKQKAIFQLVSQIDTLQSPLSDAIKEIISIYPNESGVLMPLILNVIELQPGQAMFLHAQTPHAYLKGTGLEVMASSDNVLRAGLTNKFIDVDELLANTTFNCVAADKLLTTPIHEDNKTIFPVPVNDFAFEIINSDIIEKEQKINSAEILLVLNHELTISAGSDICTLNIGESVFIAAAAESFTYKGKAKLARVYNK